MPLCIGIILNLYFDVWFQNNVVFLLTAVLILVSISFTLFKNKMKHFFVLASFLFIIIVGIQLTSASTLSKSDTFYGRYLSNDSLTFVAEVDDIPLERPKTIKLILKVLEVKQPGAFIPVSGKIMAYIQKSVKTSNIQAGEVLLLKARLKEIEEPLNPHTYNFKNYFNDQGIFYSTYSDSTAFSVVQSKRPITLWQIGLKIKKKLIEALYSAGLSQEAFSICSALITGYDDEIGKDILEIFAHSGTLHVLSVSGLHVGLIYALISFLFGRIDPLRRFKKIQFVFSIITLWLFALITGFAPPVLRAVIMFSLLGIGQLYYRNRSFNNLNILFVSAFVLLLANPLLIRNTGFLLSYSALFGILYFYPQFEKLFLAKNKMLSYLWKSASLSLSATLTTLPITLLVFHQLPLLFIIANLVVVPAVFVLLVLAIFALFKIKFIAFLINVFSYWLIAFIGLFNQRGFAYIDTIDFTIWDSVFMSMFLFLITQTFLYRRYNYSILTISLLIAWQAYGIMDSYFKKHNDFWCIYHTPKSTNVSVKKGTHVLLSQLDSVNYKMHILPSVIAANYPEVNVLPFNYFKGNNFSVFINRKKKIKSFPPSKPITHLLVSNNAVPHEDFFKQMQIRVLIADGSCSFYTVLKLKELCEKNQIVFYSTLERGAYVRTL
jgi:competence protein ComEC